jgi:hypothetical protein
MTDTITAWVLWAFGYLCTAPAATGTGDYSLAGPPLGNALVVGAAGIVTLVCIAAALWMLIDPGERDPNHPKYRVLDADR